MIAQRLGQEGSDFWTTKLPAVPLLKALFTSVGKMTEAEFGKYVVITDSVDEAVGLLMGHSPSEEKTARRMVALGFGPIMQASEASLRTDV